MIRTPTDNSAHALAISWATRVPLTVDQKAILTTELQNDRYGELTNAGCCALLHDPTLEVVQVSRPATWAETVAWMRGISGKIAAGVIPLSSAVATGWLAKIAGLEHFPGADGKPFPPTYQYDPTTSQLFQGFAAQAIENGVLTQGDVDAFIATLGVQVHQSPFKRLFGDDLAGWVLEPADVEACRP